MGVFLWEEKGYTFGYAMDDMDLFEVFLCSLSTPTYQLAKPRP